jgi:hypothetical protein
VIRECLSEMGPSIRKGQVSIRSRGPNRLLPSSPPRTVRESFPQDLRSLHEKRGLETVRLRGTILQFYIPGRAVRVSGTKMASLGFIGLHDCIAVTPSRLWFSISGHVCRKSFREEFTDNTRTHPSGKTDRGVGEDQLRSPIRAGIVQIGQCS